MARISDIMGSGYTLIACAIRKDLHQQKYGSQADHPYNFAMEMCLERLVPLLEAKGETSSHLFAESRGAREDRDLRAAFDRLMLRGNQYIPERRLQALNLDLKFRRKDSNVVGMELADLAAYPIARYAIDQNAANRAFDVIKPRFYRGAGRIYGLKLFP